MDKGREIDVLTEIINDSAEKIEVLSEASAIICLVKNAEIKNGVKQEVSRMLLSFGGDPYTLRGLIESALDVIIANIRQIEEEEGE